MTEKIGAVARRVESNRKLIVQNFKDALLHRLKSMQGDNVQMDAFAERLKKISEHRMVAVEAMCCAVLLCDSDPLNVELIEDHSTPLQISWRFELKPQHHARFDIVRKAAILDEMYNLCQQPNKESDYGWVKNFVDTRLD